MRMILILVEVIMQPSKQFRKRNAILACLHGTTEHPSAEWIFNRLKPEYPDLSLGTVYRNLALFKQQGLVASLGTVDGVERFDGNTAPHVHFVCSGCGRVDDLHQVQVPQSLLSFAEECTGGQAEGYRLSIYGRCSACTAEHNEF